MNYSELEAAIARSGISIADLAQKLGCSTQSLLNKRKGKTEFTSSEIRAFCDATQTDFDGMRLIFFNQSVN